MRVYIRDGYANFVARLVGLKLLPKKKAETLVNAIYECWIPVIGYYTNKGTQI